MKHHDFITPGADLKIVCREIRLVEEIQINGHRIISCGVKRVFDLLEFCAGEIMQRGKIHDASKLENPEKEFFDEMTPKLKVSTYGSDEYKTMLAGMKPALDHHYAANSHHPEHHHAGVDGMTLLDILEMLCDWKAAGERHANGSMENSLKVNRARFAIGDQLFQILENTATELGWIATKR